MKNEISSTRIMGINSIEEFILYLQEVPLEMVLGSNSIVTLRAFLDGWMFGSRGTIIDEFILDEFQEWIAEKYRVKGTQSWERIIIFYSIDEYKALMNFFELFKEFTAWRIATPLCATKKSDD